MSSDEWTTPPELYKRLDMEFGFTLDPCATEDNCKCTWYFTKDDDGLQQEWTGTVFVNPPFGRLCRQLPKWVRKAYESAQQGATVVCLIPARTDTAWWHDYVMKAAEVRFLRGRLNYGGARYNAPFASAIVVFRKGEASQQDLRARIREVVYEAHDDAAVFNGPFYDRVQFSAKDIGAIYTAFETVLCQALAKPDQPLFTTWAMTGIGDDDED